MEKEYYQKREKNARRINRLRRAIDNYEATLSAFYDHMDRYEHFPDSLADEIALMEKEENLIVEAIKIIQKCDIIRTERKDSCFIEL